MNVKPDLIQAASAGDPRAQLALAHFMLTGRVKAPALTEPARLVAAACSQDFAEAWLYHAMLAALGIGRAQSLDDAFKYVMRAAELGHPDAQAQVQAFSGAKVVDRDVWLKPPTLVQHTQAPRIFTAESFLPLPACEWLITQAKRRLHRAEVRTGSRTAEVEDVRTNSVAGSSMLEPDLIMQLARLRIASTIEQAVDQLEQTNVLCYEVGQQYRAHYDIIRPDEAQGFEADLQAHGQRLVTVLVYLNDGYDGGETEFPRLNQRFKGKPGDALIFWNLSANNELERDSLHAGLPVTRGEKWLLSQWVRERPLPLR